MINKGIKWNFNPPYTPHFGDAFEAVIKTGKRAIMAILSKAGVTDEELMTAFMGAEASINSKPLTYRSVNPNDDVPLTPNHFLHGKIGGTFALEATVYNPKKQWARVY